MRWTPGTRRARVSACAVPIRPAPIRPTRTGSASASCLDVVSILFIFLIVCSWCTNSYLLILFFSGFLCQCGSLVSLALRRRYKRPAADFLLRVLAARRGKAKVFITKTAALTTVVRIAEKQSARRQSGLLWGRTHEQRSRYNLSL